jgi:2-acylglycerol O-acyltransferase 2
MLQRGHSDFAWFRERAQSLQSDSLSHYTDMASTTINGQGPLSSEPSQPDERAEHNLPPKSYAAAANPDLNGQNYAPDGPAAGFNGGAAVNGSVQPAEANGERNKQSLDESKVIYEKHININGEVLTSIKPSEDYEASLKHNRQTTPHEKKQNRPTKRQDLTQGELASGRRAGAGWERSAYGYSCVSSHFCPLLT